MTISEDPEGWSVENIPKLTEIDHFWTICQTTIYDKDQAVSNRFEMVDFRVFWGVPSGHWGSSNFRHFGPFSGLKTRNLD